MVRAESRGRMASPSMGLEAQTSPGPGLLPGALTSVLVAEKAHLFLEVTYKEGSKAPRCWAWSQVLVPPRRSSHLAGTQANALSTETHASCSECNEVAEHSISIVTPLCR